MDGILEERSERARREDEYERRLEERRLQFLQAYSELCARLVRPTMDIVLDRLRQDGGGGRIVEHPGGEPRFTLPQITLWMSLEGELVGEGREDRHPYFRLDADPARGIVRVHQGDMWLGGGSHASGETDTWQLAEITKELIEQRIVEILRRAAG